MKLWSMDQARNPVYSMRLPGQEQVCINTTRTDYIIDKARSTGALQPCMQYCEELAVVVNSVCLEQCSAGPIQAFFSSPLAVEVLSL